MSELESKKQMDQAETQMEQRAEQREQRSAKRLMAGSCKMTANKKEPNMVPFQLAVTVASSASLSPSVKCR